MAMTVLVWITETTWAACVDAARRWVDADADIVLLHVTDDDIPAAAHAHPRSPWTRPLARPRPRREGCGAAGPSRRRPARKRRRTTRPPRHRVRLHGRVEHQVATAAADTDLLICARDGDPHRPGPTARTPVTLRRRPRTLPGAPDLAARRTTTPHSAPAAPAAPAARNRTSTAAPPTASTTALSHSHL